MNYTINKNLSVTDVSLSNNKLTLFEKFFFTMESCEVIIKGKLVE